MKFKIIYTRNGLHSLMSNNKRDDRVGKPLFPKFKNRTVITEDRPLFTRTNNLMGEN